MPSKRPEGGISPPDPKLIHDPRHWRDRAEEARAMAAAMGDAAAAAQMLRVAEDYEKLARRAEERLRDNS